METPSSPLNSFVFEQDPCPVLCLFVRTGEEATLVNALRDTSRIPWNKNPRIFRMDERLIDPFQAALSSKVKLQWKSERVEMLWISAQKVLSLDDPP